MTIKLYLSIYLNATLCITFLKKKSAIKYSKLFRVFMNSCIYVLILFVEYVLIVFHFTLFQQETRLFTQNQWHSKISIKHIYLGSRATVNELKWLVCLQEGLVITPLPSLKAASGMRRLAVSALCAWKPLYACTVRLMIDSYTSG